MNHKAKPEVSAEYNENGYTISVNGVEVYSAGNNRHESVGQALPGSTPLPLSKLRSFAIQTGKAIADERNGKWLGATKTGKD